MSAESIIQPDKKKQHLIFCNQQDIDYIIQQQNQNETNNNQNIQQNTKPLIGNKRKRDKNERIGATLKVGVPLLGGIASYFYTASKAFSGTKNLMFGAFTAFVLNKIGGAVYNYYQKRYVENKSVQEIAQDAYDNAVSGELNI